MIAKIAFAGAGILALPLLALFGLAVIAIAAVSGSGAAAGQAMFNPSEEAIEDIAPGLINVYGAAATSCVGLPWQVWGFDPNVTCGPLIHQTAVSSVESLVDLALEDGADVATGGRRHQGPGYFFEPTVLANVSPTSPITRSEIFGPVAPVITFAEVEEAITSANDTEMGLMAYVYTKDLAKGLSISERIQAGMVGLNRGAVSDPAAPFGGMKQSGLGREGASEGIYEFCETQYIATNW